LADGIFTTTPQLMREHPRGDNKRFTLAIDYSLSFLRNK